MIITLVQCTMCTHTYNMQCNVEAISRSCMMMTRFAQSSSNELWFLSCAADCLQQIKQHISLQVLTNLLSIHQRSPQMRLTSPDDEYPCRQKKKKTATLNQHACTPNYKVLLRCKEPHMPPDCHGKQTETSPPCFTDQAYVPPCRDKENRRCHQTSSENTTIGWILSPPPPTSQPAANVIHDIFPPDSYAAKAGREGVSGFKQPRWAV